MSAGPDRVVVVTGASRGVGLEIARRFLEKGWRVVGLARNADRLASIGSTLGERFESYVTDVTDAASIGAVAHKVQARHGKIDLLVNNAAVFKMAPFAEHTLDDITRILDTNLKGTLFATHQFLPLIRQPGGRIVNIASVAGTHGIPTQAAYCASKYGMDGFAEALAQELQPKGINITTICPGGIDTPLWDDATNPYPGDLSQLIKPQEIARMVDYVAELPANVVMKKMVVFPSNEWH